MLCLFVCGRLEHVGFARGMIGMTRYKYASIVKIIVAIPFGTNEPTIPDVWYSGAVPEKLPQGSIARIGYTCRCPGATTETPIISCCHRSARFPLAIPNHHQLGIACGVLCRPSATKPAIAVTSSLVREDNQRPHHHHVDLLLASSPSAAPLPRHICS